MKKLFAMLLALTMILSLAACGGSKKEEPKKEETATTESAGEPAPLTINFPTASSSRVSVTEKSVSSRLPSPS